MNRYSQIFTQTQSLAQDTTQIEQRELFLSQTNSTLKLLDMYLNHVVSEDLDKTMLSTLAGSVNVSINMMTTAGQRHRNDKVAIQLSEVEIRKYQQEAERRYVGHEKALKMLRTSTELFMRAIHDHNVPNLPVQQCTTTTESRASAVVSQTMASNHAMEKVLKDVRENPSDHAAKHKENTAQLAAMGEYEYDDDDDLDIEMLIENLDEEQPFYAVDVDTAMQRSRHQLQSERRNSLAIAEDLRQVDEDDEPNLWGNDACCHSRSRSDSFPCDGKEPEYVASTEEDHMEVDTSCTESEKTAALLSELQELREQVASMKENEKSLKRQLADKTREADELSGYLEDSERQLKTAKTTMERARQKYRAKLDAMKRDVAQKSKELEEAKQLMEGYDGRLQQLKKTKNQLTSVEVTFSWNGSSYPVRMSKDVCDVIVGWKAFIDEEIAKIVASEQSARSQLAEIQEENRQLNGKFCDSEVIAERLSNELGNSRQLVRQLSEEMKPLRKFVDRLNTNPVGLFRFEDDKAYTCKQCYDSENRLTHICRARDIVSKRYSVAQSGNARGYLFRDAVNLVFNCIYETEYTSGKYSVCNVSCVACRSPLGWKYIGATAVKNAGKIGQFCLAVDLLLKTDDIRETQAL